MIQAFKAGDNKISFVSKISHELRNPIHGINGLTDYLRDNWETLDDNVKISCINDISKAGQVLKDLVGSLFELSSLYENNPNYYLEKTNIVEIAKKAVENNNLFIIDKSSINLFLHCKEREIYVNIDKFWISQLMSNLINNAIKHSEAKNIEVRINLENDNKGSNIIISVIDDGIGIPKNELNSIFDPFSQSSATKESAKGSGLGLAICTEIINAHSGKIWAKNNDTGGAAISFNLPVTS